MAVLEAWAHSTPVFKTLACNMPEAFSEGAAVRVETDPSSLATTLIDWLDSPGLKEVGIRGRRLVEHSYSWPAISLKFAEVYKWLLSGGSTPGVVSAE
jgi:poly(glycerol-phosphate) alpha-glucosyltransferase